MYKPVASELVKNYLDQNDTRAAVGTGQECCGEEPAPTHTLQESLLRRRARLELQLSDVNAALAVVETDPVKWHGLYKLLRAADNY